jgi:uncharacterized membrane protein
MWLSFSRPQYLLLLPVAGALLWWSARASYADLSGARRWIAWVLRSMIVLALIFALAGAQLVKRSKELVVVFALDESFSVPAEERARALDFVRSSLGERRSSDRAALVVFGREAAVESENLRAAEGAQIASRPGPGHTDISAGMRLALGLVPPEAAGRIVLLSDGNENVGSALPEVLLARANRVPIDVVPLSTRRARDVLVREVRLPSQARRDEPFPLSITLEATAPAQATLTILVNDEPVDTRPVTLATGVTPLRVPVSLPESGFHEIEVLLESEGQLCAENDRGAGFVRIKGDPRLLLVDAYPPDAETLATRLETQDLAVDAAGSSAIPINAADLERYDAVFLSNIPAYNMSNDQMEMLRDATRDRGIGLGMIGGEFSFGAGGYYRTAVEEALPVDMDVTKNRVFPGSAVLMVMDTSGSMGVIEDGREKIELAAEAACAVVDLLQPMDSAGLIASDPRPTSVCELRRLDNKNSVKRDIRSVRAGGGGIACYPSLSAAYEIMRTVKSPIRHVILLADGSDCDEQAGCVPLVDQMAREKITVTAVAFGDGPHVPFLKEVAAVGRGKFYLTEMARDLKKIFTRETLTIAKSVLVEEAFRPSLADSTAPVSGVDWASVPPLLGYVATTPKSLARVPLTSHKQDPVFAHWQYGLGRSIAFTSDAKPHWAASWLGWDGFSQFWGQAVRWSLRNLTSDVLYPRVERKGDQARLVIDAVASDGSLINGLTIKGALNGPDASREEVVLSQVAPGRYEAIVEAANSGAYILGLAADGPGGFSAQQTFGFEVGYPPDFAETQPAEAFLRGIAAQTGGRLLESPSEVFLPPSLTPRVPRDIWRGLLWLAVILLPLDVAVRRLVVRREDLELFTAPVANALAAMRRHRTAREAARAEHMGRLLARKKEARARAAEEPSPRVRSVDAPRPAAPPVTPEAAPARPVEGEEAVAPAEAETPEKGTTERLLDLKRRRRRRGPEEN